MAPPFEPSHLEPSDPKAPSPSRWRAWARRRKHWLLLASGLLALVAVMTVTQPLPLPRVDRMLQDSARAMVTRPASDEIVIVAIDDKTLSAIGRFPWRRSLHAELLRRIGAQGPRCIGLDILMSEPDTNDPGDDAVLADAMLDNGCVVLPMALHSGAGETQRELLPVPPLAAAAAAIGHAHISVDEDGVVRSVYLREGFRGRLWPNFSLALREAADARDRGAAPRVGPDARSAASQGGSADGWLRGSHEVIAFAAGEQPYRTVSYIDVLRDAVAPDVFHGRLVLVGATAPGLGSLYATPALSSDGLVSGVEIFASVLQGLLDGRRVEVAQCWQDLLFNLVPLLVALLGLLWLRPVGVVVLIFALLALQFGLHVARPWVGIQFAPAAGFAGLLMVYPLWSLLRLTAATRYLRWGTEELLLGLDGLPPQLLQPPRIAGDFLDRQMAITAAAARGMRDLHRFVRDGIDHLPDATMVLDVPGKVLIANLAAQRHWQAPPGGLAGTDAHVLLGDIRWRHTGQPMLPPQALVTALKPVLGEGEDAKGRALLLRCVPFFDVDNEHGGWMVALVDITQMRRAQGQRDEALRFISHDIREPSAAILTIVELARTHPDAQSPAQLLERVERHAHTGLALADGFVNLARAEAQLFRAEVLDLVMLAQQAMDDSWATAKAHQVRLRSGSAPDEALCIGDRSLIARALTNILSNAIKYSPQRAKVHCSIEERNDHWRITVRDEGPGIAAELQSQLFQPFHRLHRESHPETHGVGLGLLLVRTVAQRHGGTVEIESAADAGCAVTLILPRATEAEFAAMSTLKE